MASGYDAIVIGAGPAGLTAAFELARLGTRTLVLEQSTQVGGISRTEAYRGFRFDIGGHRFFTRVPEIEALWRETLGDDLLRVNRQSRIFYRGRFFQYPIALGNALANLGPLEGLLIVGSYLRAKIAPQRPEESFEQWVSNRFGERLYRMFFKSYTEKVWGMPCSMVSADWAAQRIQGLSLRTTILNALTGSSSAKTLIDSFLYPRLGPGMMWEALAERAVALGATVRVGAHAESVRLGQDGLHEVTFLTNTGRKMVTAPNIISSTPLSKLVLGLQPTPPEEVRQAALSLHYRDFCLVQLLLTGDDLFPDNWLYIHSPEVQVGRIQNSKNWSADLVPEPGVSSLGMEYFCTEGDSLWRQPDDALVRLATKELAMLGLAQSEQVFDGVVIRQKRAYPVYDEGYTQAVSTIRDYLADLRGVQTIGRNGMHRYNNLDHSMLTGLLAARNIAGASHDLWQVNADDIYIESPLDE